MGELSTQPRLVETPHSRRVEAVNARLVGLGFKDDQKFAERLWGLAGSDGGATVMLALALPAESLEALLIAAMNARKPKPRWRRIIPIGHHQRHECLEAPGEWCRLSGVHRCDSCPSRGGELPSRSLAKALEIRRAIDAHMWAA